MCHRQFLGVISQNREYIENVCNDIENPVLFACGKWIMERNIEIC